MSCWLQEIAEAEKEERKLRQSGSKRVKLEDDAAAPAPVSDPDGAPAMDPQLSGLDERSVLAPCIAFCSRA